MKVMAYRGYGSADVLQLEEVAKPIAENRLLVKVRAAAANPLDWHFVRGKPNLMRILQRCGEAK